MKNHHKTNRRYPRKLIAYTSGGAFALLGFYLAIPLLNPISYSANREVAGEITQAPKKDEVLHIPAREPLKAIYMSQCVVGTPNFRERLVKLVDETELNALIIDIKDFTGKLSFTPEDPSLLGSVSEKCGAKDMKEFIKKLHEKDIYVIGRVTVFQDPYATSLHPERAVRSASTGGVWKDHKGLAFIDVGARAHWDYIISIAKASYAIGFDEINFDYVRFPSDGNMKDAVYTLSKGKSKAEALEEFFAYLSKEMKQTGAVISADLFGMTTSNTDDLNIGQVLERALPHFDYIYPMVYPSHYPSGFHNFKNPNNHVYDIIKISMGDGVERAIATTTTVAAFTHTPIASTSPQLYSKPAYSPLKLRPWLQDFDYGGNYGPVEVRAQMKAAYDVGLTSWLLWDPSNKYTREALLSD